jgi:hypothetical protein
MPYDEPYYIEETGDVHRHNEWTIYRRGEGVVCTGKNWEEMVRLVDGANAVAKHLNVKASE